MNVIISLCERMNVIIMQIISTYFSSQCVSFDSGSKWFTYLTLFWIKPIFIFSIEFVFLRIWNRLIYTQILITNEIYVTHNNHESSFFRFFFFKFIYFYIYFFLLYCMLFCLFFVFYLFFFYVWCFFWFFFWLLIYLFSLIVHEQI